MSGFQLKHAAKTVWRPRSLCTRRKAHISPSDFQSKRDRDGRKGCLNFHGFLVRKEEKSIGKNKEKKHRSHGPCNNSFIGRSLITTGSRND